MMPVSFMMHARVSDSAMGQGFATREASPLQYLVFSFSGLLDIHLWPVAFVECQVSASLFVSS